MRKRKPVSVANLEAKIMLGVLTLALAGATVGITLWLVDEQDTRAEAAATETGETTGAAATTEAGTDTGATTAAGTQATTQATTEATTGAETEATTEGTTQAETEAQTGAGGDATAGAEVFATAGCAGCHTLADAGATGTVGPNLDESQPDESLVVERVTNGQGAMPSFADQLSEQQIADVAAYVSQVAGA